MTTVEILEPEIGKRQGADSILKNKAHIEEETKEQPRFFCSNCEHELFLSMVYCDECGGEIDWPQKYKAILPKKEKEPKKEC